ncbi:MAG TPA: glycosyltransferase family 4 protein [Terriglobales bacterium]|nr:glycosyltransferase family 4 protein [Terriglobales bacterium]
MHILLIHQAFCGPQDPGGTRHYELARRLARMGHRFTIVTSQYSYLTGKEKSAFPNHYQIEVRFAGAIGGWHRSYFQRVVAFLSFMITAVITGLRVETPDVVIGTSPPLFQAISAWLIATLRRRPFILEIRDLWPEFAVSLGLLRGRVLIWFARRLESFLYARAKEIIVNSPSYREYLLEQGIPESKISVIPNGVDTSMYCPELNGDAFRRDHGMHDKFVVMYAGALGFANDIGCLLRAAARMHHRADIVFAIVGDGKELPRLRSEADSLRLNNVSFVAAQSKENMPNVLAAADVCVATLKDARMLKTTYPNKVFDYMAAGRPTVLAIDGAIREVIEKSQGGIFVPPGDDAALAEAILVLYESAELRKEMGQSARSFVASHFDREIQAEQIAEILHRQSSRDLAPIKDADVAVPRL